MRRRPDTELIVLARKGSVEAIDVLFDRYWPHCWKAAYAVTADRELANDAAQEAIGRAFGSLDRFDETRPFGPWLKRIAVNRAIDHLRRRDRLAALHDETATLYRSSLGAAEDADDSEPGIADAVATLDYPKRVVIVLHYWLDLPVDEIAGVLGLPVGTVASRLSRGIAELRAALEPEHVV